jgi:hypothetical protein
MNVSCPLEFLGLVKFFYFRAVISIMSKVQLQVGRKKASEAVR